MVPILSKPHPYFYLLISLLLLHLLRIVPIPSTPPSYFFLCYFPCYFGQNFERLPENGLFSINRTLKSAQRHPRFSHSRASRSQRLQ
jgi:hypothetical protein